VIKVKRTGHFHKQQRQISVSVSYVKQSSFQHVKNQCKNEVAVFRVLLEYNVTLFTFRTSLPSLAVKFRLKRTMREDPPVLSFVSYISRSFEFTSLHLLLTSSFRKFTDSGAELDSMEDPCNCIVTVN